MLYKKCWQLKSTSKEIDKKYRVQKEEKRVFNTNLTTHEEYNKYNFIVPLTKCMFCLF